MFVREGFFFLMGGVFSALGLLALFAGSDVGALLCACITVACMCAQLAWCAIALFGKE